MPFRRSDQPRLDAAEINFRKGKGAKDFVQVEGGRWKVNLRDRTLHDACLRCGMCVFLSLNEGLGDGARSLKMFFFSFVLGKKAGALI